MKGLEGEQKELEYYGEMYREPVKFQKDRGDVLGVGGLVRHFLT